MQNILLNCIDPLRRKLLSCALQGNIGTPTRVLLNLISACRLPTIALKDLGLSFVNRRAVREYGAVPYQYPVVEVQKPAVPTPHAPMHSAQSTIATKLTKQAGVFASYKCEVSQSYLLGNAVPYLLFHNHLIENSSV